MTVLDDFRASFDERVQRPARARKARPPLLSVLAKTLGTLAGILLGCARKARSGALTTGSLGFGVAGAFTISLTIGLFAVMAAGIVLEWAMRE